MNIIDVEKIKYKFILEDYFKKNGNKIREEGNIIKTKCPFCFSPAGDDYGFHISMEDGSYKCTNGWRRKWRYYRVCI